MSLNTRTLLALVGIPLVIYAAMAALLLLHNAGTQQRLFTERLVGASEALAPGLNDALGEGDELRVERLARQLMEYNALRALTLFDEQGNRVLALGRPLLAAQRLSVPRSTTLIEDRNIWRLQVPLSIYHGNDGAGAGGSGRWLEAEVDTRTLALERYRLLALLSLGGAGLGAVLLLLWRALSRYLTRPLERANQALFRLAHGDYERRLGKHEAAEFDALRQSINEVGEHLQHFQRDMQRQIELATRELCESMETVEEQSIKLDLAHRSAVKANAVKSEFLANMSHEIRTPLNGIIGFCRLLGRSELDKRQLEWLRQVHRGCDNLLRLVNDVLDFSKIEADQLNLEEVAFDMAMVIDDVIGLNAPEAQRKGLHLLGLLLDDIPTPLCGDPMRLQQVLNNLVGNAIKFTSVGEVVVRAELGQQEGQHAVLNVSVSDTGIGLSAEQQHGLFDAFTQASPSHSREYGGSGLGLSICRQLIARMGGDISIDSAPGEGARFSFTLPLRAHGAVSARPPLDLKQIVVRLHEPHPTTRAMLENWLAHWGARPVSFADTDDTTLLMLALTPQDFVAPRRHYWESVIEQAQRPTLILALGVQLDLPDWPLPFGGDIISKPLTRRRMIAALETLFNGGPTPADDVEDELAPTGPVSVLIVDDNAANRMLLKALLESDHLEVVLADSGYGALEYARMRHFDLVLMDIRMPGLDGLETTRALRQIDDTWARCPIVAVTAHVPEHQRQRWLAQGFDDVLLKPVDEAALEKLIKRFLGMTLVSPADELMEAGEIKTNSSPPALDLALGAARAGGSEAFAKRQLLLLIDSLTQSKAQIEQALEQNDREALLEAVHALNGACRYCGAPALGEAAFELEQALHRHDVDESARISKALEAQAMALLDEIRALSAQRFMLV
ncbi:ATP-binding protein [Halomonas sp. GD1P12]|uniref:ATP-binding protein n=1 Tax=Halomonas sp. GD1P12 TaxID=2982691 RepID=UPI0021E3DE3B|nr:ATP-binding protein [Halomonas sp. GD1P12]UYG01470.1 ATP-binding protein [Halomonas sp. GD1P12]